MPYRDHRSALEAKLSQLLDARCELDDDIAQLRRALRPHLSSRRRRRLLTVAKWIALNVVPVALVLLGCMLPCGSRGGHRIDRTRSDAQTVRSAAQMYLSENPRGPCPDVGTLARGQYIDTSRRVEDAWGTAFRFECERDDVSVTSAGPDRTFGTADDVT